MTTRFTKKVFNAEDGTRMLGFYFNADNLTKALGMEDTPVITFNLNKLEDIHAKNGDLHTARVVAGLLQETLGFELTPEEIEFCVEDI